MVVPSERWTTKPMGAWPEVRTVVVVEEEETVEGSWKGLLGGARLDMMIECVR